MIALVRDSSILRHRALGFLDYQKLGESLLLLQRQSRDTFEKKIWMTLLPGTGVEV